MITIYCRYHFFFFHTRPGTRNYFVTYAFPNIFVTKFNFYCIHNYLLLPTHVPAPSHISKVEALPSSQVPPSAVNNSTHMAALKVSSHSHASWQTLSSGHVDISNALHITIFCCFVFSFQFSCWAFDFFYGLHISVLSPRPHCPSVVSGRGLVVCLTVLVPCLKTTFHKFLGTLPVCLIAQLFPPLRKSILGLKIK